MKVTVETLTDKIVQELRAASRISRADFESWSYDYTAARRVAAAANHYRHEREMSQIDEPVNARAGAKP